MKSSVAAVVGLTLTAVVLAGCAETVWYKPGASQQDYATDSYNCEKDMRQSSYFGGGLIAAFNMRGFEDRCMIAHGWEQNGKAASINAPAEDVPPPSQATENPTTTGTIAALPRSPTFADGTAAYEQGDYKTAFAVWKQLADGGNAAAQQSLGVMYLHGYGVSRDFNEAVRWFTKAADQGNVHACDNLGWMYEQGNGVKQDRVRAYMWYSRAVAVASGDEIKLPKSNEDRVAATLTPDEISQAKALAATTSAP